jgi:hypothetical protein
MNKQTYDLEERLFDYSERILKSKSIEFNCRAERHHYSTLDVGRSMLDVQLG